MEARLQRSVGRVGISAEKNAKWFLGFSRLDPTTLDPSTIDDLWDDLITLSSAERSVFTSAKGPSEERVTVLLGAGTKVRPVEKEQFFKEGAAVAVPESVGESMVRKGLAECLSHPFLPTDERSREAAVDLWSRAAHWRVWTSYGKGPGTSLFWNIHRQISEIRTQIQTAFDLYLRGWQPLLDIKDVCLRVGPTHLSPVLPKHFWCMPNGLRFIKGPVLLRFVQVFEVYTRLLRRCPRM